MSAERSWHQTFLSRHDFSHEICSEIFPEMFEPLFCGSEKDPAKFPPNFPQNFPAKQIKNQQSNKGARRELGPQKSSRNFVSEAGRTLYKVQAYFKEWERWEVTSSKVFPPQQDSPFAIPIFRWISLSFSLVVGLAQRDTSIHCWTCNSMWPMRETNKHENYLEGLCWWWIGVNRIGVAQTLKGPFSRKRRKWRICILPTENQERAEYGFREYGFKHRTQWVFFGLTEFRGANSVSSS